LLGAFSGLGPYNAKAKASVSSESVFANRNDD